MERRAQARPHPGSRHRDGFQVEAAFVATDEKVSLVKLFCFLLPFGLLTEFDKLNESVDGVMKGNMVWPIIPVRVLISWMYTSLNQVGESTENPFEGGANDVPISQLCRSIEIDLREMLGETDMPLSLQPKNNIVL